MNLLVTTIFFLESLLYYFLMRMVAEVEEEVEMIHYCHFLQTLLLVEELAEELAEVKLMNKD